MTEPETTSASLSITFFGPMQVLVDGRPLPRLRSRKGIWLFALLTLRHDRPVEREWLAATLWPDMEQSRAFANLRPVLSELRRALREQGARLQSLDRQTLRLELLDADVDVLRFDAAIKSANLPDLERAVALYGGPLLEGCQEEWVTQERAVREQNCLHALLKLGEATLLAGDYEAAVRHYQRAAGLDSWSDAARRGWMEALARKGDRNAALQVYREFVNILRSESNAVPDEQTRALYQRLRTEARQQANAPATAMEAAAVVPTMTGYLPHPLTELVGREDERLEVTAQLRRSRLVTLTGPGGIGKTRLALEVAREVMAGYADGVWLVALEALTEGKLVAQQIASVLGLKEESARTLLERLTDQLHNKRLLLVLDNCEHLLDASAQIAAHLLRECAGVRILATSREPLGIPGEAVWAVPLLAVPDPAHLPQTNATLLRVLMGYESVQLFVERAQAVRKTFALTSGNALSVAQVCFRLEGIPLAIELAAARIKALTAEQIAARLDNELGLLTGGSRTAQSRQQTLRATLDWSYALLSEVERHLLRRLSVFVGGWTLEAAEGICIGNGIEAETVLVLLTALVDKSLVAFEERDQAGGKRGWLLETIRQYAREKLRDSGETEEIERKHRDWFGALAEKAETELTGAGQKAWVARLVTDYANLRAAMDYCGTEGDGTEAGLRLTGALWRFWYIRGTFIEGQRHLQEALAKDSTPIPTKARAKALYGQGVMLYRQGEYQSARECYEKALSIREQIGDRQGIGDALFNLGNVAYALGDETTGQAFYAQSLQIHRETGDRRAVAVTLGNLGNWALDRGALAEAKPLCSESLELFRELGDKSLIAWTLHTLAVIAQEHGEYAQVQRYLDESLPIFEDIGEKRGTAWVLHMFASVEYDRRRYEAAQAWFHESLSFFKELGDKRGIALTFLGLGLIAIDQRKTETARAWLTDGLHIFQEMGDRACTAYSLIGLGELAGQEGDFAAAKRLLEESLRRFRDLGSKKGLITSLEQWAMLMLKQSELEKAVRLMGTTRRMREDLGVPVPDNIQMKLDLLMDEARTALGVDACATLCKEGYDLTWEQIIVLA